MGGFSLATQAPVSLANRLTNETPRFSSIQGGIVVAHAQKLFDFKSEATSANQIYRFNMNPRSLGWISEVAEHFQHFVIREMRYRYVGTCSTGAGARVTMAPYYEPQVPKGMERDENGFIEFVRDLPGVKEFAAWTQDVIQVTVAQFSRLVFRTLGLTSYIPRSVNSGVDDIESTQPGQFLVTIFTGSVADGAPIGELWCDYVIELRGSKPRVGASAQFISTSTTDTALNLHTGNCIGDLSVALPTASNVIELQRKGHYTIMCRRNGTDPVEDTGSWTITDVAGNDVTTNRLKDTITSGAFAESTSATSQSLYVANATASFFCFFCRAEIGDLVTIPALDSGSITATRVHVFSGGLDRVWVS
jgi:hypothetical protein